MAAGLVIRASPSNAGRGRTDDTTMMLAAVDTEIASLAPLVPLLPLMGTVIVWLVGPRALKGASHWPIIIGVGAALACSILLLLEVVSLPPQAYDDPYQFYSWFVPTTGVSFNISFHVDPLTAIMLTTVCGVALLVVIYSRDYMRHQGNPERGYERFFAFMGLFVFSMCVLVLAGNFLLLYLGWEAVGLCSYLLIGFYYQRPAAARAATKAFVVNRIGDFGFGLAILLLYRWLAPHVLPGESPLDCATAFSCLGNLTNGQTTTIALLLFCGAVGKSAQLPLYVWLPDAMEGPSPVSALIHAATMVTAGVYMVVRCGPIFAASPIALNTVAVVGAATALFAATIAIAQYDMKRILAYSTISQLGYMFLGVGVFAADSAIFHLFTHAFFKSLLFLGAGSVMHAMGGIIDIREFRGLRRILPVTFLAFLIGSLALAGFPMLSGFFSKDEIIHAAFAFHPVFGILGLITAVLTALYTFRMVFIAFHGEPRIPEGVHPQESGCWMLVPLALLGVGAVTAGYAGVAIHPGGFAGLFQPTGAFHRFLAPVVAPFEKASIIRLGHQTHEGVYTLMYVSAALAILGITAAYMLYIRHPTWAQAIRQAFPRLHGLLVNKYYVDEAYDALIVRPLWRLGARLYALDEFVIDGALRLIVAVPQALGAALRTLQTGATQGYGVVMTGGIVLMALIVWLMK
ncbi:MAG: NADH-quinone oxidoreductase subunit L [Phycisphaerae bacterium]